MDSDSSDTMAEESVGFLRREIVAALGLEGVQWYRYRVLRPFFSYAEDDEFGQTEIKEIMQSSAHGLLLALQLRRKGRNLTMNDVHDREWILSEIEFAGFPAQEAPLTGQEIEERRTHVAAFWSEEYYGLPGRSLYFRPEPLSLEVAAAAGNTDIPDILLAFKPDTQAWLHY
jgi:hypothetical protein